jgi:hypothetical protein
MCRFDEPLGVFAEIVVGVEGRSSTSLAMSSDTSRDQPA